MRRIFEETLTSRNPNQNSATHWRIFSSNKSPPANRKKGFYTNRNPNKHEVGFIKKEKQSNLTNARTKEDVNPIVGGNRMNLSSNCGKMLSQDSFYIFGTCNFI